MSIKAKVLFDRPQTEIASLIAQRISQSTATSIITGFATPGGIAAIDAPIKAAPTRLSTFVVGAATYKGFTALDELIVAGVPPDRLLVHLGHTRNSGGLKHPFVRFHPMMHSKIYFMELPGAQAAAFIGSHNVTAFALAGLNAEASVLLEGPSDSPEFTQIRQHIAAVQRQSTQYSPNMKEAYAWWAREYMEGLGIETTADVPRDPTQTVRTILIFATAGSGDHPKTGETIYFELPEGVEQIESLKTEVHLFIFNTLPPSPDVALLDTKQARAAYTCMTLGAENEQGNIEVAAHWQIDGMKAPVLKRAPNGKVRTSTPPKMQQVRAKVVSESLVQYDYLFDREKLLWEPEYEQGMEIFPTHPRLEKATLEEAFGSRQQGPPWHLVTKLVPRAGSALEKDQAALALVAPESGSFLLVSVRRRKKG